MLKSVYRKCDSAPDDFEHWHHTCWSCGADFCGCERNGYDCKGCGCGEYPAGTWATPSVDFDPEFAATALNP